MQGPVFRLHARRGLPDYQSARGGHERPEAETVDLHLATSAHTQACAGTADPLDRRRVAQPMVRNSCCARSRVGPPTAQT